VGWQINTSSSQVPLVFFHFSNYPGKSDASLPVSKQVPSLITGNSSFALQKAWPEIMRLYADYDARVACFEDLVPEIKSFNQFKNSSNGTLIWQLSRRLYREAYPHGSRWRPWEFGNLQVIILSLLRILKGFSFGDVLRFFREIANALLVFFLPSTTRIG
jgi:hypothetical protein